MTIIPVKFNVIELNYVMLALRLMYAGMEGDERSDAIFAKIKQAIVENTGAEAFDARQTTLFELTDKERELHIARKEHYSGDDLVGLHI